MFTHVQVRYGSGAISQFTHVNHHVHAYQHSASSCIYA